MKKVTVDATTTYVGHRIKVRRRSLGYTLDYIALKTGLSVQMCSRYERGASQISSSALLAISVVLSIDIDLLFPQNLTSSPVSLHKACEDGLGIIRHASALNPESDLLYRRETIELVDAFYKLPTSELRKAVRAMVRTVASELSRTKALLGSQ